MNLKDYLIKVLNEYQEQSNESLKNNELAEHIRNQAIYAIPNHIINQADYKITGSPGKGVWADIPWLGIFNKAIGVSAQSGYYLVYLFRGDSKGVYLSLNQGFTFYKEQYKKSKPKEKVRLVSKYWEAKLNFIRDIDVYGFSSNAIDLKGKTRSDMPAGYENGNIFSKYYSLESLEMIDNAMLLDDLSHLKMIYEELKSLVGEDFEKSNENIINSNQLVDLIDEVQDKNVEKLEIGSEVEVPKGLSVEMTSQPGMKRVKRDYVAEAGRKSKQGLLAEKFVFENEKKRIKAHSILAEYVNEVAHISIENDGAGYDILSYDYNEITKEVFEYYIEVKSTTGDEKTPFYMSDNEIAVAKEKAEKYVIYRLFKKNNQWNYYKILNPYKNIKTRPVQYLVVPS